MKKITLLSLIVLLIASIANAQITKGSIYLGGNFGGSTSKQDYSNSTTKGEQKGIFVSPALGIAVKENLIAGITFSYSGNKQKNILSSLDYTHHGLGAGFFVRKFYPLAKKFYMYGEGDLGYSQEKYNYPSNYSSSIRIQNISASLSAGVTYNIYKSLYIETGFPSFLSLGYRKETDVNNGSLTSTTTTSKGVFIDSYFSNTFFFGFGLKFIIPKK